MIDFLPPNEEDFTFTPLYYECFDDKADFNIARYPFSYLRYFFCNKESLPILTLQIDETKIERFDMFKNIFMRGDYFYLIAYHYFLNVGNYDYDDKSEGMMKIKNENGETIKTISYFEPLYQALQGEKNKAKTLLRHEYILSKNKYAYINKLIQLLFKDYNDLDDAIRKEKNVFAKYGITVKEVYLEIFRDFYSNFVDYLSKENFDTLKKFVYPSKKEVQSFRFAKRKTYRNLKDMTAREMIINSIHTNLINTGFISDKTTYEQIDDLFNNKRRELSKIVWLKNVTALFTFYKIMEADKIVEGTEDEHWKILADYFILENDSEISREELKTKKMSTNYNLINELRSIFDLLKIIVA
ncbi:hypothetical protein KRE28_01410 [Elizabethkingia meningoseptica]|uniref:hypothetical protein n=1 Tax=Elizabethkingia meningoseptica TaxID=238 RepID=UPI0023AF28BC|nr:hypothetical protein [Elizabethkingia meningoseptica]MDE5480472.1 hypothetical protein [Elizabethkingia meningoseptica]